jgi:hypothetical protein
MKSGLVSLLLAQSTITDLVGSRIYISNAPQKAIFPHVIITQMSSNENTALDGGSGQLRFLSFDIDCKAKTSLAASNLAKVIREFIDDYSGTAGSDTIGAVIMNDEADDYEPPSDASDTGVYVVTLDLDIQYSVT